MARKSIAIGALGALAAALAVVAYARQSSDGSAPVAAAPLAGKPFYRVDQGPAAPCASGRACQARIALTALGDYHVNVDYPFKFIAARDALAGPPIDGPGAFALGDAKHGTLTVTFHPTQPGTAKLRGTFKLSVCSDATCEIESPVLELAIPVT